MTKIAHLANGNDGGIGDKEAENEIPPTNGKLRRPRLRAVAIIASVLVAKALITAAPSAAQTDTPSASAAQLSGNESADPTPDMDFTPFETVVSNLNAGLLAIMKQGDSKGGLEGRIKTLRPYVDKAFDMRVLSARTIGYNTHWSGWTDEQKDVYVAAFTDFLVASYANQFDSYSGQSFEVIDAKSRGNGSVYVTTQLNRPNNKPVILAYLVGERNNKLGIVDVYFDNVSEVARRKSELVGVYLTHGFDAVVQRLKDKTEQIISGTFDEAGTVDVKGSAPAAKGSHAHPAPDGATN